MPNNIFEWLALIDWVTPAIGVAKQGSKNITHVTYQGSGRDVELAARALSAAGINFTHQPMNRNLIVHPDDIDAVDDTLRRAGFGVAQRGYIKKR